MVERGGGVRLTAETLRRVRICERFAGQKFQCNGTAKPQVLSLVDDAHAPAAQALDDAVVRDRGPGHGGDCIKRVAFEVDATGDSRRTWTTPVTPARHNACMPKKPQDAISIQRDQELEEVIFRGTRRRMDRRDLHVALEPIVRRWIRAACTWENLAIGDYRFVIFSIEVAPETEVYVQFWSEPLEPVAWEVSSGKWNPPTDEWLAGERAARIEALGFTIGGNADNYHRIVEITTPAQVAAVAKQVVRILYDGFDYRGLQPVVAKLVHEGRSEMKATYEAFTPEDVSKVFSGLGYRVEEPAAEEDDDPEAAPMIRCRKRGTNTIVEFRDRVEEENLYKRIRFEADVELPEEERQRMKEAPDAPEGAEPYATVSVVHAFSGGVTLDWLIARISEWDAVLKEHRREVRKGRPRASNAGASAETVH
jgi:hypothetical protein